MGAHHPVGLALHDVLHHVGVLHSNVLQGGKDQREKKEAEQEKVEKYMMGQSQEKKDKH